MKKVFLLLALFLVLFNPIKGRYIVPNLRRLRNKIEDNEVMVFPEKPTFLEIDQKVVQKIILFAKMVS